MTKIPSWKFLRKRFLLPIGENELFCGRDYHITLLYLAQLSYFDCEKIERRLAQLNAKDFKTYENGKAKAYWAEFDSIIVVSFGGTCNFQFDDLMIFLTFWKDTFLDTYAHKGFLSLFNLIGNDIATDLEALKNKDKKMVFVGHSMGGALVTLLAVMVQPDEVVTYGAPRVTGGKKINKYLENVNFTRYFTKWDWVSILPPTIPGYINYQHFGMDKILGEDEKWTSVFGLSQHILEGYGSALIMHVSKKFEEKDNEERGLGND